MQEILWLHIVCLYIYIFYSFAKKIWQFKLLIIVCIYFSFFLQKYCCAWVVKKNCDCINVHPKLTLCFSGYLHKTEFELNQTHMSRFLNSTNTSTLTPMHLRKAKLIFFYNRYPSSAILKIYFPDIKFNKNNTAQLVKWFSNFR